MPTESVFVVIDGSHVETREPYHIVGTYLYRSDAEHAALLWAVRVRQTEMRRGHFCAPRLCAPRLDEYEAILRREARARPGYWFTDYPPYRIRIHELRAV